MMYYHLFGRGFLLCRKRLVLGCTHHFLFVFKRTRKMSIVAAISVGVTSAVGYGMKNLVGRMRPSFFTDAITVVGERSDSFSFPSGHTLMSFACALILLRYDKRIGIPAVVFAALHRILKSLSGRALPD